MRKLFFLLLFFPFLKTGAQKTQPVKAVTAPETEDVLLSKTKYRLVGPWRGGRSGAVTGSYKNKNTFYFGATGGEFGRLRMEEATGKISRINILAGLLAPFPLLPLMKT